ncbi:MAG: glycoside hydrolase family 130 protein, partial [Deltaproteobacteria bacterium]|nr:glycoside hydrolase family 130 protein [Deltaproteobacteria bacterium]
TITELHNSNPAFSKAHFNTQENIKWIIRANYDVAFEPDIPIDGRCLFPNAPAEKHGIEDARFVRFTEDGQSTTYYATATAFDGKNMLSQIIETEDFQLFKIRTLNGEAVQNKGMALFPRKIGGKYAMLGRQDNEYIYLMYSLSPQFWRESVCIVKPAWPWEFYQIGNCGSPIETEAGWLVITHGVGAMRRYAIGALLLDLDDPSKIIGRSETPILIPNENEREGYVPNVVYSCGSMIHNGKLILPYAMSDYATRIALVDVPQLLAWLQK